MDTIRSTEPIQVEMEYELSQPLTGLRVGLYFNSTRGEPIFTSFDLDDPDPFREVRLPAKKGRYISTATIPANFFNEGRVVIGVNASSYRIKRYFQDEQALVFSVDATGAPGMHWSEVRMGPIRPLLEWKIEAVG